MRSILKIFNRGKQREGRLRIASDSVEDVLVCLPEILTILKSLQTTLNRIEQRDYRQARKGGLPQELMATPENGERGFYGL